eukprot:353578-Chlamydomonas_euryale.AAC.6
MRSLHFKKRALSGKGQHQWTARAPPVPTQCLGHRGAGTFGDRTFRPVAVDAARVGAANIDGLDGPEHRCRRRGKQLSLGVAPFDLRRLEWHRRRRPTVCRDRVG